MGDTPSELVLLHGGGQNAHTWDTVALALGRPLLAVDLPGHGHSARRRDRDYGPWRNAEAVAAVIERAAPTASGIVGMSLGGATLIRLAATRPDLVRRCTSRSRRWRSVERGVRHNARRLPDGRWTWRYDLLGERPAAVTDHRPLWEDLPAITVLILLVVGSDSPFVPEQDAAEFRRHLPATRTAVVMGAGHAVQSDKPLELAALIEDFIFRHS